ncbi:MAG: LysM peptidoglycan-binding domain-containing protein [Flavobacteriaceae bacterium]|nr:LysM peptidoglycan-binding domain-containing protein [Flavobacteriaceae bacterium]
MKKTILIIIFLVSITSFSQEKKYTTYRVTDSETVTSIAKKLGVTPFNLLKLNPDAKNGIEIDEVLIIPNRSYKSIASTKQITTLTLSQKDSIKNGILYHTVKSGETIYSLCRKYKVKKKKILKLNKLKRKSKISLGQVLKFPTNKKDTFSKKEETNNIENKFFNYTVAADDTKYALARKYKISVDELEGLNPQLISKALNEYDVIKLPIINTETQINPQVSETHTVQFQETFYSLIKHYNTTKEKLIDLNPELKNGLKEGMQIKIPKRNSRTPIIRTHLVKKKETYYSLNKLYNVTKEDLLQLNPELKEGLKEGMLLKISKKIEVAENLLNIEANFSGKKLDVALLLPFTSIKKDKNLNKIIDFYLGAIMAINDLKKKGLSVNLKVLDTKGDKATISNIVNTNDFSNADIIIGPMYYSNLEQITKTLQNNKAPIISPVATNDHRLLNAENVIQNAVSKKQLEKRMLDFIKKNYTNQNIIIIANNEKESKLKTTKIENYLKSNSSINKVTVLNLEKGYIRSKKFNTIDKKKENWVIILDDKGASEIAVEGFKSTKIKATLFALNKSDNFDNIKNSDLNKVNFHYPTTTFVDNKDVNIIAFNKKYESKYSAEPSNFAYKGYDAVKDALLRIATYKNVNDSFQTGQTKGLTSNFNYVTTGSSHANKAIFVVKYKDFEIVKVE